MIDLSKKRVCVTGGAGFLGRHIVSVLERKECGRIYVVRSHEFDLRRKEDARALLLCERPDIVIHAAAQAGGIGLNQAKPGELFYNNAVMGINLMEECRRAGVEKFVTIGTVCEYPKFTPVPFVEEDLWTDYPEETNASYGIAKKALLVMGQAYRQQYGFNAIHLLPVNLYGPGDNFGNGSHVIPALIKKIIEAKKDSQPLIVWGHGLASREFLYVEDCAEAIIKATESYDKNDPVNVGMGSEIKIRDLVELLVKMLDFRGPVMYDISKPNGQPRRCLNTSRARKEFGFEARTDLETGLQKTIDWYLGVNA